MTTTWKINKLFCKISEGSLTNVVDTIYWECKKSDGVNEVSEKGFSTLDTPDSNAFVQYNNLTKEQVIAWIQTNLGTTRLTALNDRLDARLTAKTTMISLDPPFQN